MESNWTVATFVDFLISKGYKKKEIADRIGKNPSYLSRMINGKAEESKTVLSMLLMEFKEDIVGGAEPAVGDIMNPERAILLSLLEDYAEWKAESTGVTFEEVKNKLKKRGARILGHLDSWLPEVE